MVVDVFFIFYFLLLLTLSGAVFSDQYLFIFWCCNFFSVYKTFFLLLLSIFFFPNRHFSSNYENFINKFYNTRQRERREKKNLNSAQTNNRVVQSPKLQNKLSHFELTARSVHHLDCGIDIHDSLVHRYYIWWIYVCSKCFDKIYTVTYNYIALILFHPEKIKKKKKYGVLKFRGIALAILCRLYSCIHLTISKSLQENNRK